MLKLSYCNVGLVSGDECQEEAIVNDLLSDFCSGLLPRLYAFSVLTHGAFPVERDGVVFGFQEQ